MIHYRARKSIHFFETCLERGGRPACGWEHWTLLQFPPAAAAQTKELRLPFLRQEVATPGGTAATRRGDRLSRLFATSRRVLQAEAGACTAWKPHGCLHAPVFGRPQRYQDHQALCSSPATGHAQG